MIAYRLTLRWPSGITESHLFTHESYAHATYHALTANAMSASKPAWIVEPVDVHDGAITLATLRKV